MVWKKDKEKIPVWRCAERFKSGNRKCKNSRSLNEEILYRVISDELKQILDTEIENSSAQML